MTGYQADFKKKKNHKNFHSEVDVNGIDKPEVCFGREATDSIILPVPDLSIAIIL